MTDLDRSRKFLGPMATDKHVAMLAAEFAAVRLEERKACEGIARYALERITSNGHYWRGRDDDADAISQRRQS